MFILKKGHQPGVYVPLRALFLVLHKIICCGCVLESPHRGDSNTHPKHMILWRTNDNQGKNTGLL